MQSPRHYRACSARSNRCHRTRQTTPQSTSRQIERRLIGSFEPNSKGVLCRHRADASSVFSCARRKSIRSLPPSSRMLDAASHRHDGFWTESGRKGAGLTMERLRWHVLVKTGPPSVGCIKPAVMTKGTVYPTLSVCSSVTKMISVLLVPARLGILGPEQRGIWKRPSPSLCAPHNPPPKPSASHPAPPLTLVRSASLASTSSPGEG